MQFSAGERYTKQAGNGDGEMTKNARPPPADRCSTGFYRTEARAKFQTCLRGEDSPQTPLEPILQKYYCKWRNAKGAEPMGRLQHVFWRTAGLCILPHCKPAHKHNGTQ